MRSDDTRNNPDANTDPRLQLVPASTAARVWLFLLTVGMPMSIVAIAMALAVADGGPMRLISGSIGRTAVIALGTVAALTLGIWLVLDRLLQRHRLRFDAGALVVKSGFNGCTVAYADLQLHNARVVDLASAPNTNRCSNSTAADCRVSRVAGTCCATAAAPSSPSLAARACSGSPRHSLLLLQPSQPQALLNALRTMADGDPRS